MRSVSRPGALPGVGTLVNQPAYRRLVDTYSRRLVVDAIRAQLDVERREGPVSDDERAASVAAQLEELGRPRLRRVINASGVILHTNLGRAPLSAAAVAAVTDVAAGYSNLELNLASGKRGERASIAEPLLQHLTGAEAALVVNNNASAVLLALTALCRGREVIVSRGQLVEIGGSFRMPDVMRLSGARMVEVGTTNRTRVGDYEAAITERTAAILRVHTSNFRVTGFTESAPLRELAALAHDRRLLLLDDLGSGALQEFVDEPVVQESVAVADLVSFSGDKLVGGPQAGVLLGRREVIQRLARHALARAVRVDKLTLAALEATLQQWLFERDADIPVARMLHTEREQLRRRAALWQVKLTERGLAASLLDGGSAVGGGALPGEELPTVLVALPGPASRLAAALRSGQPPVIARIEADLCCLDPRTVLEGEDETLLDAVEAAALKVSRR